MGQESSQVQSERDSGTPVQFKSDPEVKLNNIYEEDEIEQSAMVKISSSQAHTKDEIMGSGGTGKKKKKRKSQQAESMSSALKEEQFSEMEVQDSARLANEESQQQLPMSPDPSHKTKKTTTKRRKSTQLVEPEADPPSNGQDSTLAHSSPAIAKKSKRSQKVSKPATGPAQEDPEETSVYPGLESSQVLDRNGLAVSLSKDLKFPATNGINGKDARSNAHQDREDTTGTAIQIPSKSVMLNGHHNNPDELSNTATPITKSLGKLKLKSASKSSKRNLLSEGEKNLGTRSTTPTKHDKTKTTAVQLPTPQASRNIPNEAEEYIITDENPPVAEQMTINQSDLVLPSSKKKAKRAAGVTTEGEPTKKRQKMKDKMDTNMDLDTVNSDAVLQEIIENYDPDIDYESYHRPVQSSHSRQESSQILPDHLENLYHAVQASGSNYIATRSSPGLVSPDIRSQGMKAWVKSSQPQKKTAKRKTQHPKPVDGIVPEPDNRSPSAGPSAPAHSRYALSIEVNGELNGSSQNTDTTNGLELRANGKSKRRLPVDDDPVDTPTSSARTPTQKKPRKQSLKPKTPIRDGVWVEPLKTKSTKKKARSTPKAPSSMSKMPNVEGKFSDEELAEIALQMEKFREMHNMTVYEQNQLVQSSAAAGREMWDMLSEALPDRSRISISKLCRRRFHNFSARGKWTEEDDEELKDLYESYPKGWKKIAEIMVRHPEDCRDRWRNYLICGDSLKSARWTETEEQQLRAAVAECKDHIRELQLTAEYKDRPEMDLIDWFQVSDKMGNVRSRLQCQSKWKQLEEREDPNIDPHGVEWLKRMDLNSSSWRVSRARVEYSTMGNSDKLDLLRAIQDSQASREGKVPWVMLGDDAFKTKWSCMVRKVAWKKMRLTIEDNREMQLQDIVAVLIENIEAGEDVGVVSEGGSPKKRRSQKAPKSKRKINSEKFVMDNDEDVEEEQPDDKQPAPTRRPAKRNYGKKLSDRMVREEDSEMLDNLPLNIGQQQGDDDYALPSLNGERASHDLLTAEVADSDDGDGDVTMANGHGDNESIDLDAQNREAEHQSQDGSNSDWSAEIPNRRPGRGFQRQESMDLDAD